MKLYALGQSVPKNLEEILDLEFIHTWTQRKAVKEREKVGRENRKKTEKSIDFFNTTIGNKKNNDSYVTSYIIYNYQRSIAHFSKPRCLKLIDCWDSGISTYSSICCYWEHGKIPGIYM